jgi:hypothetical protein
MPAGRRMPVPSIPGSVHRAYPIQHPQRTIGNQEARWLHSMAGQPLDSAVREQMEPHFGHDFSRVRVHTDAESAETARALDARAYTFGYDIVFGRGEYAPRTAQGARLLAHELTHVLQQGGGVHLVGGAGEGADVYERNADAVADQLVRGGSVGALLDQIPSPESPSTTPVVAPSHPWVQRQLLPGSGHVVHAEEVAERQRTVAVINVIGHASPRWRSAKGAAAADQQNARLSEVRAESVRREIERQLRLLLGSQHLVFEYNYTPVDPTAGSADIVLGEEARGSQETLIEAGGRARQANDPAMRRVEVSVRLRSTIETEVEEDVDTTERRPGATTEWSIVIAGQAGVAIGPKAGGMVIQLRNEKTGVIGTYLAEYGGGEFGIGVQIAQASFSWSSFSTPVPMSFGDFDPSRFEITLGPGISVGIGAQWAKFHFTSFVGSHKPVPDEGIQVGGFTAGDIGGTIGGGVFGSMYLQGHPQESINVPIRSKREQLYSSESEETSIHRIFFSTGSADISSGEAGALAAYLRTVAAEWPVTE